MNETDKANIEWFRAARAAWLAKRGVVRDDLKRTRKRKKVGRISVARDRKCVGILIANGGLGEFPASTPLVTTTKILNPITKEKYQEHFGPQLLDPMQFDWRSLPTGLPTWSHATPPLRMVYTHHALDMSGTTTGFTLNLSNDLIVLFQAKDHRLVDAFRKRLGYHLKAKLGRKVDFWFAMESPQGRFRWHLHGGLGISEDERPQAKRALLAASGIADGVPARSYALRFSPLYEFVGWASYACKKLAASKNELGYSPFYASRTLSAYARDLYQVHRHCAAVQRAEHKAFLKSRRLLHS